MSISDRTQVPHQAGLSRNEHACTNVSMWEWYLSHDHCNQFLRVWHTHVGAQLQGHSDNEGDETTEDARLYQLSYRDTLQRPKHTTRNMHREHFINLPSRTDTLKSSFLPNTIRDWNLLPSEVIEKSKASKSPVATFASIVKGWAQC